MTPERWQRVEELFHAAAARQPEERPAFLAAACGSDSLLLGEVESLLASDEQSGGFVDASMSQIAPQLFAGDENQSPIGQRVGAYQLTREISRGGMGVVYLGVRADDQYQKQVAVKLIKRGVDTEDILRRFRHERQILANLDHPNIARLLDGGTNDDGLPFFVMEYIEGEPIDKYCDRHKLPTIERLKLFRVVCSAVHYAHQTLVVHRDLKPSNVLVTAEGVPKLLDFGVAKLLTPETSAQTSDLTATALRLMTPAYASPEQIRGEAITTASDIYSLGVVLYELLTGRRPYRFKSRLPHEIVQVVCETEPERPSTAISRVEETHETDNPGRTTLTPEGVSETRDREPAKLRRQLAGDVDNIVLKALRKEPQRRYASVEQFSEDIHRHLAGLPVTARKDTLSYRTGKFIRRNKLDVTAAALIVVLLLGGIVIAAWQARVAQAEREKAEQRFNDVRKLANSFMFKLHDAIKDLPGSTPARQLLVNEALEYLDSLAREASDDPSLQRELATAYQQVGEIQYVIYDRTQPGNTAAALASYRKALAIREALAAAKPEDVQVRSDLAVSYMRIGELLVDGGDVAGAIEVYRKGLEMREALSAADPANAQIGLELALGYRTFFRFLATIGSYSEADKNLLKAVEISEALFAADSTNAQVRRELVRNHQYLGEEMWLQGHPAKTWECLRRALAISEEWAAKDPASREALRSLFNSHLFLGDMLMRYGDPVQALEHYRQMLITSQDTSSKDPMNTWDRRYLAQAYERIGDALAESGDAAGALGYYRKNIAIQEALSANDPTSTLSRRNLGGLYINSGLLLKRTGDTAQALEYARQAQEIYEALLKEEPNHEPIQASASRAFLLLAQLLTQTGQASEARGYTTRALAIQKAEADKPGAFGDRINNYAWSLLTCEPPDLRDPAAALSYASRAAELTHENDPNVLKTLSLACHLNGDPARAAETATKALTLLPPIKSTLRQELESQLAKSQVASKGRSDQ